MIIKRLLYLVAIWAIIYLVQYHFAFAQDYWFVWTAFTLSLIALDTPYQKKASLLVLGLMTALAVFLTGSLSHYFLVQTMVLVAATLVCVFLERTYLTTFFLAYSVNFFIVLASGLSVTHTENIHRTLLIIIASLLTTGLYLLCFPYFIRSEWRSAMIRGLRNIKSLNTDIFSCLLQPDYRETLYLFERRLHVRKTQFMQSLSRLREIQKQAEKKMRPEQSVYSSLLAKMNLLYDNMLDYAQIRRRVSDPSTFSLCSVELSGVAQAINQAIDKIILECARTHYRIGQKKSFLDINPLEQKINRLDDNYQHVLQVAAKEPLAFILFIDSLNSFCQQLEEIFQLM